MNTFLTLMKREYWENRGGFVWAPLAMIAMFVLLTALVLITVKMRVGSSIEIENFVVQIGKSPITLPPDVISKVGYGVRTGLAVFALIMQVVLGIVVFFYLLGSLYDDRKDRSILFWKSMPVSDFQTLVSKFVTGALVAPIIAWIGIVVLQLAMLSMISLFFMSFGFTQWTVLWTDSDLLGIWIRLLVGIGINVLWTLPAFGWLMMVSSWARTLPFLWAVFAPLVAGLMLTWIDILSSFAIPQKWFYLNVFGRGVFGVVPWSFGTDGDSIGFNFSGSRGPYELFSWQSMADVLTSANLWIGVAAGLAMLAAAFYFRRYREIAD